MTDETNKEPTVANIAAPSPGREEYERKREERELRKEALAHAVTRPRAYGGMMQSAPDVDKIVEEAGKFAAFLRGDE